MLCVEAYVAESTIPGAGKGLFAGRHILKGEIVWELVLDAGKDTALTSAEFENLPKEERDRIVFHGYYDTRLHVYIKCGDASCYVNHSETPNIEGVFNDEGRSYSVAIRDIAVGEEICDDYRTYDGCMVAKGL